MSQLSMPEYPYSYWYQDVKLPSFKELDQSIKTEVAIIGAGMTGITTAYLLSQKGLKVTVIDAGSVISSTSGHTTAKITIQHGLIYNQLIKNFNLETAKKYFQANKNALEYIKKTIKKHEIMCDFSLEDAYLYTNSQEYLEKVKKEAKAYEQIGIEHSVIKELPIPLSIKEGIMIKDQAQFHPVKYLRALIDECIKNDVEFYDNTTAIDVEYTDYPIVLTKNNHRINCDYLISASHYPFYDGQAFFPTRMYADRSYITAYRYDQEFSGGMYISAESPNRSIRRTVNDSGEQFLLIGGESHKVGQGEETIFHYEALQEFAKETFNVNHCLYRWSAQDLVTLDDIPYIGPITEGKENILVATGYRKWGMTTSTVAAQIMADIVTKSENDYKNIFSPARKISNQAIKNFVKYNADVAKHLIKGKMEYVKSHKDLPKDSAALIRINGKRSGVYRDPNDKLHAVDTTCTHLGCEVNWNDGERTWDCPCHGSRFSYTGEVIEGPAKKPLKSIVIK